MNRPLNTRSKAVQLCACIVMYLTAVISAAISIGSLLYTSGINTANPYAENILSKNDFILTNLALIGLTVLGAIALLRSNFSLAKVDTRFTIGVMLLFTTLLSLAWVHLTRSVAGGNAQILLDTAKGAAQGDYRGLHTTNEYFGSYSFFHFYPYELGYVLFAESLYRIFGAECPDLLFQIVNILALDGIYLGVVTISRRLFEKQSLTNLTAVILALFLPPMFVTTLPDGTLPALVCAVWGICHTLRYTKENRLPNSIFAVVLMILAVVLRHEFIVIAAAVCIALLLHAIDKKKLSALALIAVIAAGCCGAPWLVINSYSARSNAALGSRITPTLAVYAGINPARSANGWYNGLDLTLLKNRQLDEKAADTIAAEEIAAQFEELNRTDRLYDFYKNKLLSQVNEPSFEAIWVSQVQKHDIPEGENLSHIATSVYNGGLQKLLSNWFNYDHMLLCLSFTAGMIWLIIRRRITPETVVLPSAVAGGILWHMLFEAKSLYILPYFILLIPFAVYGLTESVKQLKKITNTLFE